MKSTARCVSIFALLGALSALPAWAEEEDAQSKADRAVANLLFEYDGAEEFASYLIRPDGFVDITFASNMPDALYSELLAKLQKHPDINGVIAGKGGYACQRFGG
jgi:SpoVK/Ycf46/Vps4 family AAA+-type ATPase